MFLVYYFLVPLLFLSPNLKNIKKSANIFRYIIGLAFSFLIFYVFKMDKSISLVISILGVVGVFQIVMAIIESGIDFKNRAQNKGQFKFMILIGVIFLLVAGVYNTIPYSIGQTKKLYGMVNAKESDEKSPKVNTENIIIVPPETAYYQMQNMIGSLPNPSFYKIGQLNLTQTPQGAYYVAPIEFEGNIKALLNRKSPGIVYVSAERLEEPKIIEVEYNHSESLLFNNNIYRKMRSVKQDSILLNANIELDDTLKPYYIGSYGHYKYGRNGIEVDGVIVYELETGETKTYPKDKTPEWIDQIYTYDVAEQYNEFQGRYKKGLINSKIGQKEVHIPTNWSSGLSINGLEIESTQVVPVVGNNGEMYFFTDHTNTSENSTTMTGYTLMDSRTGEMVYYKTPGLLNGQGAMNSVEKLLGADKANWATSQPILYNVYGVDTWIVPVINRTDGSFVKLGLVAAESKYSMLADNKTDLLDSFKKAIAEGKINSSSDVKISNDSESIKEKEISGTIWRINQTSEDGKAIFYIKLEDNEKIFMINKNLSPEVILARDGDKITLKYIDMEEQQVLSVTSFNINK